MEEKNLENINTIDLSFTGDIDDDNFIVKETPSCFTSNINENLESEEPNYKKETVNPPKKCFILRGFQKKHKVVEVVVVEKNTYIKNKQQRFIEIVK